MSQMPTPATSQQKQGLVSFVPYCAVQFQRRRGSGGGGRGVSFNRFSMIGSFLAKQIIINNRSGSTELK